MVHDPTLIPKTFRKLLLHKCHEEFEKRKNDNAGGWSLEEATPSIQSVVPPPPFTVLEKSNDLSAEEKEENVITKWKMLGNIKFVGKSPES